jgi:hypothetical protein
VNNFVYFINSTTAAQSYVCSSKIDSFHFLVRQLLTEQRRLLTLLVGRLLQEMSETAQKIQS